MPFVSDRHLSRIEHSLSRRHQHSGGRAEKAVHLATTTAEVVGGAMLVAFVRGKMEDKSTGAWNVPGTTNIDLELVVGVGLAGASMFGAFGGLSKDVGNAANGVLAHYLGQVARKFAHTGQFTLIAGGGGPKGYLPGNTQMGASSLREALRDVA